MSLFLLLCMEELLYVSKARLTVRFMEGNTYSSDTE
jgi:hypothetical protein